MIPYQIHHQPDTDEWLEFATPVATVSADDPAQVLPALIELQRRVEEEGLHAAGWVDYAAASGLGSGLSAPAIPGSPLLSFGLYQTVTRLGELPQKLPELVAPEGGQEPADTIEMAGFDAIAHADSVNQIKAYLQSGDSYQVNYTQLLNGHWPASSAALFRRMVAAQPRSYAGYLLEKDRAICSVSPELFFALDGAKIRCKPMKGTARRGHYKSQDLAAGVALRESLKDQAENLMVVDMVRNDLGRIARTGTVSVDELFELEQYPTVWQLTSTISAQTDATLAQIFAALFPCASIVGAPKRRTMEIITELEREPRGIYTGAIGWLLPGRQAQFNVAIRTAVVDRDGDLNYGVGGGIVWDSDPQQEARECLDKARVVTRPVKAGVELLETLRWSTAEGYWLFEEHINRLAASAEFLHYRFDSAQLRQKLLAVTPEFATGVTRVRLKLNKNGQVTLSHQPLVKSAQPLRVAIYPVPLVADELLRFHKSSPRPWLEGVPAPADAGVDDWLFTNPKGELTESTIANLVIRYQGTWLTPQLTAGLLAGTYRHRLLATRVIKEARVTPAMIRRASQIGLINSVRGWRSAILVD